MYRFIIQTRATDGTLYNVPLHYTDKSYWQHLYNVPLPYTDKSYWQHSVQCTAALYRQELLTAPCTMYCCIIQIRATNSTLCDVPLHYYSQSYWQYPVQCTTSIYRQEVLTAPCTMYHSIIQSDLLTAPCRMCQFSQYPQPFRTPTWSLHTS